MGLKSFIKDHADEFRAAAGKKPSIQEQIDQNSQAWHNTTDKAEQNRLHQENQKLHGALDKESGDVSYYNPSTGRWDTYKDGVGSGDWIGGNGPGLPNRGGGGGYTGAAGGGVSPGTGAEHSQENYYAQLLEEQQRQFEAIRAQEEAAKRAAVEQAVGQLNGQKGTLEQNYSDLYRQLYIDRRRGEKSLPQQMAAMGYNGGLTESSALALQTQYGEALRQGEQAKLGTMNSIDQAIENARLSGDISIADAAAQTAREQLASYGSTIAAMQQQDNWQQQFGYQQTQDALAQQNWGQQFGYQQTQDALANGWKNKQWDYSVSQDQYENEKEKALFLAGNGNFSALGGLWGMSDTDVQSLAQSYAQQNQVTQQQAQRDLADWYAKYGDFSQVQGLGVKLNMGGRSATGGGGGTRAVTSNSSVQPSTKQGGGAPIQSYAQLGIAAQGIAQQMAHTGSTGKPEYFAERIEQCLKNGSITEEEAIFLMTSLGY